MTAKSEASLARLAADSVDALIGRAIACACNGVVITDASLPNCPIIFANTAFTRITGYTNEEALGKDCRFLQNGDRDQASLSVLREALKKGEAATVILRNHRKDGSPFWNRLTVSPVLDDRGKVSHYIGFQTDLGLSPQTNVLPSCSNASDALTGLPTRQALQAHLSDLLSTVLPKDRLTTLLVLDIDRFSLVNASCGDAGGDRLLRAIADRLHGLLPPDAFLARFGSDEFAVALTGTHNLDLRESVALAETLAQAVAEPFLIDDAAHCVTCSIGASVHPRDTRDAVMLLRYADIAMQHAKDLGRNNVQFFSSALGARLLERAELEVDLRLAIERDELSLFYQPLVDLQTGQVAGVEALLRWSNAAHGTVEPDRFIPIAEECGMIESIGEWALRRAFRDMRQWSDAGIPHTRVAVNVSPCQFRDPLFGDKIADMLANAEIEPGMLSLEITEKVLMQGGRTSEAVLTRLHQIGVDLVLDDFGTGFSSLGYLKRFWFKKVKIDRSFIDNIATDPDDAAIAKAVISMAHSLGIRVVAEGVETEPQCDFLRRNMCDEIQGFLFSKPVPAEQVADLLRQGRCLPQGLLRFNKPARTLLLVDDETNIVSALKRLLRRDNYTILTANSGAEGLEVLAHHAVDVIVSDQRMPGMTGVEFLGRAKELYPDTVRIVLSGYTELQSVTDAVNQGAAYKFLTKPWDDTQLRGHIEEAFRRKEMADENRRLALEVQTANSELAAANRRLGEVLDQQQQQIRRDEVSLDVVREMLRHVPVPVIGIDEENCIAFINAPAQALLGHEAALLGADAPQAIPEILDAIRGAQDGQGCDVQLNGLAYQATCRYMGQGSESRGRLITLSRELESR